MNKKTAATGNEHPVLVLHYTRHEGIRHWLGFCDAGRADAVDSFGGHFSAWPKRTLLLGDLLLVGPVAEGQVARIA